MKSSYFVVLLMGLISTSASANWNLVNQESNINYVSIKKTNIAELNKFNRFTGTIDDKGYVDISIDLSSVETNIEIRNQRMRELFFNTTKFAQAKITGSINLSIASKLSVGKIYSDKIKLNLSLHGVDKELEVAVQVIKIGEDKLYVT